MKYKNFTFKTEYPTGMYKSFDTPTVNIKYEKKECGLISWHHPHTIKFTVYKPLEEIMYDIINQTGVNSSMRWVRLKKEFNSLQEAKNYLNSEAVKRHIFEKYDLYRYGD